MLYVSPVWHAVVDDYRDEMAYMVSAMKQNAGVVQAVKHGQRWMLDNGAYTQIFRPTVWRSAMDNLSAYSDNCIGVVVPDVVGDSTATLDRWRQYADWVRGYPRAFVTQDGVQIRDVPWSELDVLFIGGADQHKLKESWPLISAARRHGRWIHVGRVNSATRILLFWMADSCDGTTLAREPSIAVQRLLLRACREARTKREGLRLL